MPGSWQPQALPYLTADVCEIKSPFDRTYNCISFAAGEQDKWWWPTDDDFWPEGVPKEVTFGAFVQAFQTKGFAACNDGELDPSCDKIALYGKNQDGQLVPTHAAKQLPDGKWASKLGKCEDVHHATVGAVEGPAYGSVVRYLRRPKVQE